MSQGAFSDFGTPFNAAKGVQEVMLWTLLLVKRQVTMSNFFGNPRCPEIGNCHFLSPKNPINYGLCSNEGP